MKSLHCPICGRAGSTQLPYCPAHGTKMRDITEHRLFPPYDKTYGVWKITTEGDCEGRTVKHLGIYRGHIDEIARSLANTGGGYSLQFSAVDIQENHPPARVEKVSVSLDIESRTWDYKAEERANVVGKMFKENNRPVTITPGQYYASFIINYPRDENE